MKRYTYVGSHDPAALLTGRSSRVCIRTPGAILEWIDAARPSRDRNNEVIVTFIIDAPGDLWIADQRSEHVVCAQGGDVLSAGEMTFSLRGHDVEVIDVSNQSTGYCPEPESWPAVAAALDQIGLSHPGGFTAEFIFRRCDTCGGTNIVKDDWFECAACGSALSADYNFGPSD